MAHMTLLLLLLRLGRLLRLLCPVVGRRILSPSPSAAPSGTAGVMVIWLIHSCARIRCDLIRKGRGAGSSPPVSTA